MKIENLEAGMRVPNYRALCRLLEVPAKSGDAKGAHLKELSRYCEYSRSGNAFIIEEIYKVPKTQQDGRQKYLYLIEPILLNYFAELGRGKQELSWYRWFQELGMVDARIYNEAECEEEVAFWGANPYSLFRLKNLAKNKMREILSSALENMKKKGIITYEERWKIITRDAIIKVAEEWHLQYIQRVHKAVLEEIGAKNMSALGLSPKLNKAFQEKTHDLFYRGAGWRSVFKEVKIEVVGNAAELYREIDPSPLRKELNQKVCAAVRRMARRADELQKEKMMDAWEQGDELPRLTLPLSFVGDVEILVEWLMVS